MVEQDPPNDGLPNTGSLLGANARVIVGFGIMTRGSSADDRGLAVIQPEGSESSAPYGSNLTTSRAMGIGRINGVGTGVEGRAIPISQP